MAHNGKFTSHLLCLMILVVVTLTSLLIHPSSQIVHPFDPSIRPVPSTMWSAGGDNNDQVSGPYYTSGENYYYQIISGGPTNNIATSGGEIISITNEQYYILVLLKSAADDKTVASKSITSSSLLKFNGAFIQGSNLVVVGINSGQMIIDSTTISTAGSFQIMFKNNSGSLSFTKTIGTPSAAENTFVLDGVTATEDDIFSVGSIDCASVSNGTKVDLVDSGAGDSLSLIQKSGTVATITKTKWDASSSKIRILPASTGGFSEATAVAVGTGFYPFIYVLGYYSSTITFQLGSIETGLPPSAGSADPFFLVLDSSTLSVQVAFKIDTFSSLTFDEPKAAFMVRKYGLEYVYIVGYQSLNSDRILDGEVGKAKAAFVGAYFVSPNSGMYGFASQKSFTGDIIFTSLTAYGPNILVTGYFSGTVTFGSTTLISAGGSDILLVCFDSSTLEPKWAYRDGGVSNEFAYSISEKYPYIWVSGTMSNNTSIRFLQVSFPTQSKNSDGFQIGFGNPFFCNGIVCDNDTVCNSHGDCNSDGVSKGVCNCDSGYSGSNCENYHCFGKINNAKNVCSGHGTCIDADTCICSLGYGNECQFLTCNGIKSNDTQNVCSGRGTCVDFDTCSCPSSYGGPTCSIPKCFDILATNSSACNGNGLCLENHTCICDNGWKGANCSIPFCFGIPNDNSTRCSSHGECIAIDDCKCTIGYEGKECQNYNCFGISKNSTSVCSNQQGTCVNVNTCECFTAEKGITTGAECEQVKCFGASNQLFDSNDVKVCSGHGSCEFYNSTNIECNCSTGYMGSYCQYPICDGIPSYSKQVCSGNGQCVALNTCSCYNDDTNGHYKGKLCEKCKAPYSGAQCNYIEPCGNVSKCHSHGYCDEYGLCTCFQDDLNGYWNGSTCNYCNNGFYGEDCLTQIQSDVKFSNYGDSLVFKLSYPPHFTSSIVNCSKLFDSSKKLFGSNPICKYLNKNSNDFAIELDQDHSINIGDQIELNRNVFNRFSNVLDMTIVKVLNATNPSLPVIITSNKEVFAKCENVVLDASSSYSLDRKYNSYKWEIISSNLNSISNSDVSKVTINYDSLNVGNHTFQITVTSYIFKVSNIKRVTIQKMDYIAPAISIDGSSSIQVKTIDVPIIIRKSIETLTCIPSNSKQVISWEYLSGSGIEYRIDSFNDLKIVKFNDLTQTNHQFKVSAYVTGFEQQVSTAIVNIQLVIRPLTVNLILVESTPDYTTFEIEEIDPDNENTTLSRVWSFTNLVQSNSLSKYLIDYSNTSTFTITKQLVQQSSQFDLSVQINKRSRSATSTISISFPDSVAKIAPTITLANTPPSNLNKGTPFNMQLLLTGEGNHTSRIWSLNTQSIPNSMVSLMRSSLQDSNSLLLATDSLTEGSQNRISFTVTNMDSSLSASIDRDFIINVPPKACICQVSPSSGIALTTLFSFNCPSCQNNAKTYSFEYGFIDDYSGASVILSKDVPISQKLPPPNYGTTLQLYVKVIDTLTGASAFTYNKVTINLPIVTTRSEIIILSRSWTATSSYLQIGDYKRNVFNSATITRTTNLLIKFHLKEEINKLIKMN